MKILYILILTCSFFTAFSQDVPTVERVRYDSLKNFLGNDVRGYIGQTLYLNKKPHYRRSEGYEGFVLDYTKYKYDKANIYECCGASYSKYEAMAGKRFKVLDVQRHPQAFGRPLRYGNVYYLQLLDIEKKTTMYYEYNANMEALFPFICEGFWAKTKRRMIGSQLVLKNNAFTDNTDMVTKKQVYCAPGTVWNCDNVIVDEHYNLALVLSNNKNQKIAVDYLALQRTRGNKYFSPQQAKVNKQKFGTENWHNVLMSQIRTGMTKEMCRIAWGEPQRVNATNEHDKHGEQWVYEDQYLYFNNGVLTSTHY